MVNFCCTGVLWLRLPHAAFLACTIPDSLVNVDSSLHYWDAARSPSGPFPLCQFVTSKCYRHDFVIEGKLWVKGGCLVGKITGKSHQEKRVTRPLFQSPDQAFHCTKRKRERPLFFTTSPQLPSSASLNLESDPQMPKCRKRGRITQEMDPGQRGKPGASCLRSWGFLTLEHSFSDVLQPEVQKCSLGRSKKWQ